MSLLWNSQTIDFVEFSKKNETKKQKGRKRDNDIESEGEKKPQQKVRDTVRGVKSRH